MSDGLHEFDDGFAHLDGASAYSLDDSSSAHSGSTSSVRPQPPTFHQDHHIDHDDNRAIDDINNLALDFDQLNMLGPLALDSDHHHGGGVGGSNGAIDDGAANLYEEDFDGMLDDLNRELPAHACRSASW